MIKFLSQLNSNLNLFSALSKKLKKLLEYFKNHKVKAIVLPLIVIIVAFFTYQKFVPKPPEKLYDLTAVKKNDLTQTVTASGKIHSQTEVELKFQTSGQLAWIGVKQGDPVKKWQAIASLDKRTLKKQLEQELIDYSKERNDFEEDRLETYDPNDMEITQTIKRILQKNQWDLQRAVLDVELQDIALKYATLITPIDGLVTTIDIPVAGVNITPATARFVVADSDHLVFEAEIDEADIGLIQASQSAQIILDAFPNDPITATVDWVDFNSTLDSSGSTIYIVKFYLSNQDKKLRLGMNGEVTIITQKRQQVLTIPFLSLIEDQNGSKVQLVKDGKVVDQPVTTGIMGESDIEILMGLQEGQTIVVSEKQKP